MSSAALTHPTFSHLSHLDLQNPSTLYLSFIHANVFEVYVFGIMPGRRSCLSCHTQTNQQFLKTVAEQSSELEELRRQLR